MTTKTQISCPECTHSFHVEDVLALNLEKSIRAQLLKETASKQQILDEQLCQVEKDKSALSKLKQEQSQLVQQQLEAERQKMKETIKQEMRGNFDDYIKQLKDENSEKDAKLREQQQRELELLKTQRQLQEKEQELELAAERRIAELKNELETKIRTTEQERVEMKLREKDKQLEDLKRMLEEAKRKSEQGSVQLQGEVQETALEEFLRYTFPFDLVEGIGKGVRGADVLQTVHNHLGRECGKIFYESKRTKAFSKDWIEKLKADALAYKADIAVLVTEAMPKDMDCFGHCEGIWICTYQEVQGLSVALRDCIIKVGAASASQENKGTKMHMLYDYLTGSEFRQQIEAVVESMMSLKKGISRERVQMEKLWKEHEKQQEKAVLNLVGFYGSIKGIAGSAVPDIDLLIDNVELLSIPALNISLLE